MNALTVQTASPERTVAFETLGCKLNQYETDSIATTLRRRGFRVIPFGSEPADAYIINSCTVTNKADRKSRNTLYRVERFAQEHAREHATERMERPAQGLSGENGRNPDRAAAGPTPVVFTGCFVDSHPGFDHSSRQTVYLVDNRHKNTIPDLLEAHFRGETVDPQAFTPNVFGFHTPEQVFHTRTNIKIQDGCDNFCTFCIIPRVRGRAVSRTREAILREAREAITAGSRELVLTGVNMSRYRDTENHPRTNRRDSEDFVDLVEAVLDISGTFRVRISSLEPDGLNDRFARLFEHPRMCPHLHLCLQSGSARILHAMRRMYTLESYRELVQRLRSVDPLFNLTTDLIVGFPGETRQDFEESVRAIGEYHLGHVHVFPFSPRAGTRAGRMTEAIDPGEIRRRTEEVQDAASTEKRRYRRKLVGRTERVLVERTEITPQGILGLGLGEHYVPVRFSSVDGGNRQTRANIHPNRFYSVEITGIEEDGKNPRLVGRIRTSR